jgi:hypothetical protein
MKFLKKKFSQCHNSVNVEFQKGVSSTVGVFIDTALQSRHNVCVCVFFFKLSWLRNLVVSNQSLLNLIQCSKILGDSLSLPCFLLYYELVSPWHMC